MYRRFGLISFLISISIAANAEQIVKVPAAEGGQAAEQPALETPAQTTQVVEQVGFSKGEVARSALTSAVENREPTDSLDAVSAEQNQLFFFTELRDMSGQTARHRWEHDGKVMAEVEFNVRGNRWRVWSSKNFVPGWTGDWKVSVLNGVGEVISEKNFTYETASVSNVNEPATTTQGSESAAQ